MMEELTRSTVRQCGLADGNLILVVILVYESYLYSDSRGHFNSLELCKKMSIESQRKLNAEQLGHRKKCVSRLSIQ